jgi:hypothetical protein
MPRRPLAHEVRSLDSNRLSDGEVALSHLRKMHRRPQSSFDHRGLAKDAAVNYLWRAEISAPPPYANTP